MILYHVTETESLPMIKQEGLQPRSEERSKGSRFPIKAIHFFHDLEAVYSFLRKEYKDKFRDKKISLISVDMPKHVKVFESFAFEYYTLEPIEYKYLEILSEDFILEMQANELSQ